MNANNSHLSPIGMLGGCRLPRVGGEMRNSSQRALEMGSSPIQSLIRALISMSLPTPAAMRLSANGLRGILWLPHGLEQLHIDTASRII